MHKTRIVSSHPAPHACFLTLLMHKTSALFTFHLKSYAFTVFFCFLFFHVLLIQCTPLDLCSLHCTDESGVQCSDGSLCELDQSVRVWSSASRHQSPLLFPLSLCLSLPFYITLNWLFLGWVFIFIQSTSYSSSDSTMILFFSAPELFARKDLILFQS